MLAGDEQVDEHHGIIRGQRHVFQQDIIGLQVIVEEFQSFGQFQGVGQLTDQFERVQRINRGVPLSQLLQAVGQRIAVDGRLGHVGRAAGRLADVQHLGDVGVAHLGQRAGATDEPPGEGTVLREFGAQNLQPHLAVVIHIVSLIQGGIALFADVLFYFVLI